jgi:DNA-binding CsgD family transcriptional regulator
MATPVRSRDAMFDMHSLSSVVLPTLTMSEQHAIRLVADGLSPREIAARLDVSEESLYRLVAWVLEEVEPAPAGRTVADVHAERGSRAATVSELDEFERLYAKSLAPDDES